MTRPSYLRTSSIALVLLGGVVGVGAREGLSLWIPNLDGVPVVVPVVNVLGAFALGYLYEALTRLAPGETTTSRLKLLIGTGFCGGLTTYSSLATDTAVLLDDSRFGVGALYVLGTVLVGGLATFAGIVAAARLHAARQDAGGTA
ncbi:fluoride efflux transporter FluC [Nocardioides pantholopis]|uniref:fluoride efflux transporter FluC n=1 Tax=Nocardioides pantholopis TaxID=2483798 RepID=UPI0019D2395E|nr:CrcB family protein [Nocardioides pantholopis]